MASHQLRTPISAIRGYVSLLLDGDYGKMSEEQKKVERRSRPFLTRGVFIAKILMMKIKKDKYLQKRGGSSKILDIFCQNCSKKLFIYQKDGIGQLKRCYFNRIMTDNIQLENNEFYCPQCKEKIGFGITHTNKRFAIKLLRGKIKKKLATK